MPAAIVWQSLHLLPLVVLLLISAVVAVAWLYPSQLGRVRWPWTWLLPMLRLIGLFTLAAALLQPVGQRLRRASERGSVLVLIDRSKSMSVTDVTRTPAPLVALADGLGRLSPGARSRDAADLAVALESLRDRVTDVTVAANDVQTAEAFGRGVDAARERLNAAKGAFTAEAKSLAARSASLPAVGDLRARLAALNNVPESTARQTWAADARSRIDAAYAAIATFQADADRRLFESNPQVKAVCDELARSSRTALVEQALLRPDTGLLARLSSLNADIPVSAYVVGDRAKFIALPKPSASAKLPPDAAAAESLSSDLTGGLSQAIADAPGRSVRAVVLFTDGRQVGGNDAVVSSLSPAGAPVFAVPVAPTGRAPDVTFSRNVSVPSTAFVGETVTVRATVTAAGFPQNAKSPAVDVQLKAGEVVQSQRAEIDGGAGLVEFELRLEHGGAQRVVLSIPPTPGEITAENNIVERWIKVLPERLKVAAYAGTPGWDFQLLRGELSRTPWVRLESGVLDPVSPKFPLTAEQILAQDVLILSDVSAESLDDVQWDAVNRLVREHGGSLFLLAGRDNLPSTYTPQTIVPSALLPYDVSSFTPTWRAWPGEQPAFRFAPAEHLRADQADALRIGSGRGTLRNWQGLGGAFRFLPIQKFSTRLGATTPLLVESDSRLPVLTESAVDSGRVVFLGTNETWRWRSKTGNRDFARFWLQLIRYAAGDPYSVQRELVSLDTDKVSVTPSETVNVRARILEANAAGYHVEVLREGDVVQIRDLAPVAGAPKGGRFTASVSGLTDGDYVVRLTNPTDDSPSSPSLETPLHVAASSEAEMMNVAGDESLLRRIADASGGQVVPLERLGELPRLLAATGGNRSQFSEFSPWDNPLFFAFIVACFGAEWALRKRVGLA